MHLKELKKEIDGLTRIEKTLKNFQKSWLKQLKPNTNQQFPFLQKVNPQTKKELNQLLSTYPILLDQLTYAKFTQEKLSTLAQYLVELKLTTLNDDTHKPKILVNKFLKDDFLRLNLIIDETKQFEYNLNALTQIYQQANHLLIQNLPLEHSVHFLDAPHKNHLNTLYNTSKKQKKLLNILGKEFISLTKEMKRKKKL